MIAVRYEYEMMYDQYRGRSFPMLACQLSAPGNDRGVFTKLLLDSGAEVSILEGSLAGTLGLDLRSSPTRELEGIGGSLIGRRHPLQIHNDVLGTFTLDAWFGPVDIRVAPPILGRDFFRLARIGFDEESGRIQFSRR